MSPAWNSLTWVSVSWMPHACCMTAHIGTVKPQRGSVPRPAGRASQKITHACSHTDRCCRRDRRPAPAAAVHSGSAPGAQPRRGHRRLHTVSSAFPCMFGGHPHAWLSGAAPSFSDVVGMQLTCNPCLHLMKLVPICFPHPMTCAPVPLPMPMPMPMRMRMPMPLQPGARDPAAEGAGRAGRRRRSR